MSESIVQAEGFMRPIRPERDLLAVADLIEQAFQLQNDPDGQFALRSMRSWAVASPSWQRAHQNEQRGYVWESAGKIVGNCSLLAYPSNFPQHFIIANVAVAREFQARGIARALLRATLGLLPGRFLNEVWLQVRSDNSVAIQLYRENGFAYHSSLCRFHSDLASLRIPQAKENKNRMLSYRQHKDWPIHRAWLEEAYPSSLRWYSGSNFEAFAPKSIFMPSLWAERISLSHQVWRHNKAPLAFLSSQSLSATRSRLFLACPQTETSATIIPDFLQTYLAQAWQGQQFSLEFPAGPISQAIAQSGFKLLHQLDWMHYEGPSKQ